MLPLVATLCTLTIGTLRIGSGLPCAIPADVQIASDRLAAIDVVVKNGLAEGGYPGAAVVVGRRGHSRVHALLFGSTPGNLIQIATVPVTVVP